MIKLCRGVLAAPYSRRQAGKKKNARFCVPKRASTGKLLDFAPRRTGNRNRTADGGDAA